MRTKTGMTLIELVIAMSIFLFLGMALVGMFRSGLAAWSTGERKREVLENAQTVVEQITSDLKSVYTTTGVSPPVNVRFIADVDPSTGLPRLRFVRTIRGEVQAYLLRDAGKLIQRTGLIDENNDFSEAYKGSLMPTGGLCEVAYVLARDNSSSSGTSKDGGYVLYRGIRSPIGDPAGSVFNDSNMATDAVRSGMKPFARNVLYMGFLFWTQHSNTWSPRHYTRTYIVSEEQKSGPMLYWDSTRGYLPAPDEPEDYEFFTYRGTLNDPSDDIFPSRVKVTVVLREGGNAAPKSTLASSMSAGGEDSLKLVDASMFPEDKSEGFCFVLVDDEWIEYTERSGRWLSGLRRGARHTRARTHKKGAVVETGHTVAFTATLPSYREAWYE